MLSIYHCRGVLTSTPELKYVGLKKTPCTNFFLRIKRDIVKESKIDTFRFVAFGEKAEYICTHAKKGDFLEITSSPQQNVYFNQKNNVKVDSINFKVIFVDVIKRMSVFPIENKFGTAMDNDDDIES